MKTKSPVAAPPRVNIVRAMRERPIATIFATGFGVGFAPIAPGTAGSALALAAAWIAVAAFSSHMTSVVAGVGLLTSGLILAAAGVPLTGRVAEALGGSDPGCIVLDEIAGQLIASAVVPLFAYPSPSAAAAAWGASFLAFRLFDVWKPGPIRGWQDLPGGWGIVVDDVAAGVLAAAATAAIAGFLARAA
ncbi:MAG TPA: phosphatidylglycerophosphatase A [Thermoanaerobaculia bacterium]|jgi:phosphatidylglycerophosphatase A|nr:phosphatidylglycerophosphatase A [Thermoanaerobaculia bacterium]